MDNNDIENYYKNIDKPIINNCIDNLNLKNLLALSTVTDVYIFKKEKNNKWKLKNKRELLNECEKKKKNTIKNVSSTLNDLIKNDNSKDIYNNVKKINSILLNKIENIDSVIETIEKDYPKNNNISRYIEIFSN